MILSCLLLSSNLMAQGGRGPGGPGRGYPMTEEGIKERVDQLAETLKLNDDQHKQLEKVEMDFYKKIDVERQKMRNEGGPLPQDREARRDKMMQMREERDARYKEILTEEQFKQYQEIQEKRRSEMRNQYRPEGNSERPSRGRGRN